MVMKQEWFKKDYTPRFRLFCKYCNIFESGVFKLK